MQKSLVNTGRSIYDGREKMTFPAINPSSSVQVQEQPKQRTSRDIINEIFSTPVPKPTYDPNRTEETKRQMRLNSLGRGLKVLGDAFSLSKGANVVPRQPDNTNQVLLGKLHNYIDNYNKNLDTWNYQNYMNNVKKGITELNQINIENKAAADLTRQAYEREQDERNFKWREGEPERQQEFARYQSDLRMKEDAQKLKGDLLKATAKVQANNKGFMLYDDYGNTVKQLGVGELEKAFDLIIHDPVTAKAANDDYTFMKAEFGEGLTKQTMQTIIGGHWQESPEFLRYIGVSQPQQTKPDNSVFKNINSRPPYLGPYRQHENFSLPGIGSQNISNTSDNTFKLPGL